MQSFKLWNIGLDMTMQDSLRRTWPFDEYHSFV
jgi:hypothetical protein